MSVDCEVRCTDDIEENVLLKKVDKLLSKKRVAGDNVEYNYIQKGYIENNKGDELLKKLLNKKQEIKKNII